LVDDKGCVLIALWGVPTAAYPDNAARAVTAAGRICTVLGEMDMQVSAGVTTGVVYCGCVGNTVQRAYCAVGDVVNLAARLMGKAHGGILVDEATVSRLPAEIKLAVHKQAPIALKGKDKEVTPYRFNPASAVDDLPAAAAAGATATPASHPFADDQNGIRQVCYDAFVGPIRALLDATANGSNSSSSSSGAGGGPGGGLSGRHGAAPEERAQFLVMEGPVGTGREEAVRWLRSFCQVRPSPGNCIYIPISPLFSFTHPMHHHNLNCRGGKCVACRSACRRPTTAGSTARWRSSSASSSERSTSTASPDRCKKPPF
jgi:hypothetical protein